MSAEPAARSSLENISLACLASGTRAQALSRTQLLGERPPVAGQSTDREPYLGLISFSK